MASKIGIGGIVAWVLAVVLALAAGSLGFLNQKQAKGAAGLRDALVQVANTAGVQELEAEEPVAAAAPASAASNPVTSPGAVVSPVTAGVADTAPVPLA